MKTTLNIAFMEEVKWKIRLSEKELGERAGLSPGYIYRLLDEENSPGDMMLSTIDRLYEAIVQRMGELGMNPPDDLWMKLLRQEH